MKRLATKARALALALPVLLAGCGGYVDDASPPTTYSIGGTISGLGSSGLVLANGADSTSPASGALGFTFGQTLASGSPYAVTVLTQPANATCSVSQGAGTVGAAAVTTVQVTCAANAYRVGGTISGLVSAGLVLANGADTVAPSIGASSFKFASAVAEGGSYAAMVQIQPSGTTCSVGNGSGSVGAADVTNIQVTCSPNAYSIGGTITGLTATGLVLANGADTTSPSANATSFALPAKVAFDGIYSVVVQQQPTGLSCTVGGAFPATMGAADVTSVAVTCSPITAFTLIVGTENCNFNNPYVDGAGAAASVQSNGMTRDSAGNLYVVSGSDDVVRKVTPAGVVTTIAGLYLTDGNVDGTAGMARFHNLSGIAADASGNVYVTELNDVRKVTPSGVVSTVAGGAGQGFVDGSGIVALLNSPNGVAFDSAGNAYVADSGNEVIRKVTSSGLVTTLAGGGHAGGTTSGFADGTGTAALFSNPFAIAIDAAGNLFVADVGNNAIRKVTPGGVVTTFAGGTFGFADGSGAAARFNAPRELAFDGSGNLYVIDQAFQAIRIVSPTGVVTTLAIYQNYSGGAGIGALPPASVQLPQQPQAIAGNPSGAPYVGLGCAVEKTGP